MNNMRILLVDDHTLFRGGIAGILRKQEDMEIVGEAGDGRSALELARSLMPDLILMDIAMPLMDGLEATRNIKSELPYVVVIMLTASDEDRNLFEAIKCGAQGYLLKSISPEALVGTLRGVIQGEAPVSRVMARRLLDEFARQARAPAKAEELTARERGVLELVALGKSNKEIAAGLSIAENTVKNHLKNILEKLHLQNRVQAATYALREGLITRPSGAPD